VGKLCRGRHELPRLKDAKGWATGAVQHMRCSENVCCTPRCYGAHAHTHLLSSRQAPDVGVHGKLRVQAKVAAELLNGSHGQRPRLLAHLRTRTTKQGGV